MCVPAIRAEALGKMYRIGHATERERYIALRDVIGRTVRGLVRSTSDLVRGRSPVVGCDIEEFWALRDVSFEIGRGEVVGIIGRNGAGKSTLLKILSRITEPSEGRVVIRGRVASLLEVGTGFHPELTGSENIYLNGALLGMSRAEIKRKFEQIVDFAEVDKFLDTPVKRYSSGMYVRLAFSVAAHLEPDILIVDEVLAVGDAEFQKKCLGKMEDVAGNGRTVLFVSHNMAAVERLCGHVLLLSRGRMLEKSASVRAAIGRYMMGDSEGSTPSAQWRNDSHEYNNPAVQPLYFAVVDANGHPLKRPARVDEQLFVVIRAEVRQQDPALNLGVVLYKEGSEYLFSSLTTDTAEPDWPRLEKGLVEVRCAIPKRLLNEGTYRAELHAGLHNREWVAQPGHNSPAIWFSLSGGLSDSPYWLHARPGPIAPVLSWTRTV